MINTLQRQRTIFYTAIRHVNRENRRVGKRARSLSDYPVVDFTESERRP